MSKQLDIVQIRQALASIGIVEPDLAFAEIGQKAGKFQAIFARRLFSQASHEILNNFPLGLTDKRDVARLAISRALTAAIGEWVRWSGDDACEIAAAILEDVNLHELAETVRNAEFEG